VKVFLHRCIFELLCLLYRLRAQVECRRLFGEEWTAAGESFQ
jgi:hypothetical protein